MPNPGITSTRWLVAALILTGIGLQPPMTEPASVHAQAGGRNGVCGAEWLGRLQPALRVPTFDNGSSSSVDAAMRFPAAVPRVFGVPDIHDEYGAAAFSAQMASAVERGSATVDGAELAGVDELNQLATRPNDTFFRTGQTENLRAILSAHEAWQITFGSSDVTIAVISDGVDLQHRDLASKIWRNLNEIPANGIDDDRNGYVDDIYGWDFGSFDNDPSPISMGPRRTVSTGNRGTMMAGIAAAETNNKYGIAGVSWGARIMPLQAMFPYTLSDAEGNERVVPASYTRNLVESICYATNNGARIILMGGLILRDPNFEEQWFGSIGSLRAAVQHAAQQGVFVVAPTGECGQLHDRNRGVCPSEEDYGANPALLPGALDRVVAVASISPEYASRVDASTGSWVDIAAPGETLWTTVNSENYSDMQSVGPLHPQPSDFAAAHIAGAAALLWSANPSMSPLQVESQLCNTASRSRGGPFIGAPQRNDLLGCGVANLERAVETMAWRIDLPVSTLRHYVKRDDKAATMRIANHKLNDRTWEIRQDVPWISDQQLAQQPGQPSELQLAINFEALPGSLAAGDQHRTVLRACPVNNLNINRDNERDCEPYSPSGCYCLTYELVILDEIPRVFLPLAVR